MKRNKLKVLYGFLILVLYLVFGSLLLLKYFVWQEVPSLSMGFFGIAVIAYGIFRGYRTYQNSKEEQDEVE